MTKPGASSSPPGMGFGAGEGPAAAIVVGDAKLTTLAPATVPAAVRTNFRLPRTPPADAPVMRLLSLEKIGRAFCAEHTALHQVGQRRSTTHRCGRDVG